MKLAELWKSFANLSMRHREHVISLSVPSKVWIRARFDRVKQNGFTQVCGRNFANERNEGCNFLAKSIIIASSSDQSWLVNG